MPATIILAAQDLVATNDRGVRALDMLSFELRAGEVLGVTGVDGNGQRELGRSDRRPPAARQRKDHWSGGRDIGALGVKARKNEAGIGFMPEDRQYTGLVLDYPVATNLVLRDYDRPPVSRRGILDFGYMARNAVDLVKRYDVRLRSPQQPARFLSGGNQQKVILAREIEAKPRILIIMQACKGLDVGAIEFVQNTIFDLKKAGVGVLYVSTELEHVMDIADRIAVMYRGRITGILTPDEATAGKIRRADGRRRERGGLMARVDAVLLCDENRLGGAPCSARRLDPDAGGRRQSDRRLSLALRRGLLRLLRLRRHAGEILAYPARRPRGRRFRCKAGLFNVGAEGQIYMGALFCAIAALYLPEIYWPLHLLICALAGALGGAFWAAIAGYLKAYRGINEVIVTLLLNYVGINIVSYAAGGPMMEEGAPYPYSREIPPSLFLPHIMSPTDAHIGAIVGVLLRRPPGARCSNTRPSASP